MNPGEANQISSFRSENLPCNRTPEAANDKSSPVSGGCLCLLKTLRDLSPSSPLCQDDKLSFEASRWPFVCDDLLIFFSPPLAWLFILPLVAVVLPSSSPREKVGRTAAASKEVKKKKKKDAKKERWTRRRSPTFDWLPNCKCLIPEEELLNLNCHFLLVFSSVRNLLRISKCKYGLHKKYCTGTGHAYKHWHLRSATTLWPTEMIK